MAAAYGCPFHLRQKAGATHSVEAAVTAEW